DRIVPRQYNDHRSELHVLGLPRHIGEELEDIRTHRILGEMVLHRPDGVKAERLSHLGKAQLLTVDFRVGEGIAGVLKNGGVANMHDGLLCLYGRDTVASSQCTITCATPSYYKRDEDCSS